MGEDYFFTTAAVCCVGGMCFKGSKRFGGGLGEAGATKGGGGG